MSLLVSIICFLQYRLVKITHCATTLQKWTVDTLANFTMAGWRASKVAQCWAHLLYSGAEREWCWREIPRQCVKWTALGATRFPNALVNSIYKNRWKILFNMHFRSLCYPQCSQGPGGEKHNSGSRSATWVPSWGGMRTPPWVCSLLIFCYLQQWNLDTHPSLWTRYKYLNI